MSTDEDQNNVPPAAGKDPATGRFLPGNKVGKGNPFAGEMARFRASVYRAVRDGDLEAITQKQIDKAKRGDTRAATLIYEILGVKIKQIEASVTTEEITPDEARRRVAEFFGEV